MTTRRVMTLPIALALVFATTALEAQESHPVNLALVTPIQIHAAEDVITAFRFNLLYGRNAGMSGLDLGLANHVTGHVKGVQLGAVNLTGSGLGVQWGMVNINEGEFEGVQWGTIWNQTGLNNGLQLGLVNYAQRAKGVQVGLINIIKEGGQFPFMVIVNWGKNK
jgi:hypothetical protein